MFELNFPDLNGFSLHVTVHIAPENLEAFYAAMTPVFDVVAAEPECLFFELYQDPTNPGTISWVENWDATTQWFKDVQMQKDYYKPYFEATMPMYIKDREFRILKRLGPRYIVQKEVNVK